MGSRMRVGRVGAALVGVVGLVVLVGWYSGVASLTTLLPGYGAMRPNAALALIVLAIAVLLLDRSWFALPLGLAVAALGFITLLESALSRSFAVDVLLPGIGHEQHAGRIAVATATALVLLGAAIAACRLGGAMVMRSLAITALAVAEVAVLGYAYGAAALYTAGGATGMALNTAVCVAVLAVAILLHDPNAGLVGLIRDKGSAGRLLRAAVPSLVVGPAVLGWLGLRAQQHGWFGTRFGVGLLVLTMTVLGFALIWRVAVTLRQLDWQRDQATRAMAEANESLEARVTQRTKELADRRSFADALLETMDVGVFSCDADDANWRRNRAGRAMLGLDANAALTLAPEAVAPHIEVRDTAGRRVPVESYPLMRALRGEDVGVVELLLGPAGGPFRESISRSSQIIGADGTVLGAVSVISDISAERTAARALDDANTFLNAVLSATPDFTFIADLATGAIVYGSRDRDILGISTDRIQALGETRISTLVHPDDQSRLVAMNIAATDLADGQVLVLRYRGMHADGQWRWLNRRITPFRRDASGHVVEVLGVLRDISDIIEAENRLAHAALHDDLTGLPNRSLLIDRLDAAILRSGRDNREVAVLFCDLDGFKSVNDTAGHAAGDMVLVETARRLRAVLRPGDTVARVGGDEFVIVVEPWNRANRAGHPEDATSHTLAEDRALAIRVAERVGADACKPITVDGVEHVVTASIGIAYAGLAPGALPGSITSDRVLEDADAAMYLAKALGKDRFEIFEHGPRTDRLQISH